jgi:hypothetical protein
VVSGKNPMTFLPLPDVFTGFDDFTGQFVPQHQRSTFDTIPLHEVAAADAAGNNLYEDVVIAYVRNRLLFEADVAIVVIHADIHRFFNSV